MLFRSVAKGGMDKPQLVYQLLAFTAFEMGELEEAMKAVDKALTFKGAEGDRQLLGLKAAIKSAQDERAYHKEQELKKLKAAK